MMRTHADTIIIIFSENIIIGMLLLSFEGDSIILYEYKLTNL